MTRSKHGKHTNLARAVALYLEGSISRYELERRYKMFRPHNARGNRHILSDWIIGILRYYGNHPLTVAEMYSHIQKVMESSTLITGLSAYNVNQCMVDLYARIGVLDRPKEKRYTRVGNCHPDYIPSASTRSGVRYEYCLADPNRKPEGGFVYDPNGSSPHGGDKDIEEEAPIMDEYPSVIAICTENNASYLELTEEIKWEYVTKIYICTSPQLYKSIMCFARNFTMPRKMNDIEFERKNQGEIAKLPPYIPVYP